MSKFPSINLEKAFKFKANVVRWVERENEEEGYGYLEVRFKVAKKDIKTLQVDDWDNLQVTIKRA